MGKELGFTFLRSKKANPLLKFSNRGFTLIELILYMAIVTIVMGALIPFAWNVIGGSVKSSAEQEVSSQARFVSEKIKYEIRNASSINEPLPGTSGSVLNLNSSPSTVISLNSDKVQISDDGGAATNLNSNDTSVSGLTFTSYESADGKTKHIQFSFTIDDNYTGTRQEYNAPAIAIESSAELRSNP